MHMVETIKSCWPADTVYTFMSHRLSCLSTRSRIFMFMYMYVCIYIYTYIYIIYIYIIYYIYYIYYILYIIYIIYIIYYIYYIYIIYIFAEFNQVLIVEPYLCPSRIRTVNSWVTRRSKHCAALIWNCWHKLPPTFGEAGAVQCVAIQFIKVWRSADVLRLNNLDRSEWQHFYGCKRIK